MKKFILYTVLLYNVTTNAQCWESIANGIEQHVMAIQTNGTLWGWGNGEGGKLGNTTGWSSSTPEQIGTATDWKSVSAGISHSFGVKDNGTLWGWGINTSGCLGTGSSTLFNLAPVQVGT